MGTSPDNFQKPSDGEGGSFSGAQAAEPPAPNVDEVIASLFFPDPAPALQGPDVGRRRTRGNI